MSDAKHDRLRNIPAVEILLGDAALQASTAGVSRKIVVDCLRTAVNATRQALLSGTADQYTPEQIRQAVLNRTQDAILAASGPHYRKVINATGIILHTALGRAVLPANAIRQITQELTGYSLLQADVDSGARSKRDERIEWLLHQLTGAEAATVVNNNAAATSLVLSTVAKGKEVLVSRGQLVEIGGSFRLPEVMEASGAKLVEVGTTNKTHPRDYQQAITENTAAIMRVHPSNYKISGFTSEVSLDEMVRIAHAHNLVLIDDVGAGPLIDFSRFGFDHEPTLRESVDAGADLVTASADKLIGASQGGIILGRAHWIERVRKNPLARMLRVGKLTLAALEATLTLFLDESVALQEVPTLRMLRRDLSEIAVQAERIVASLQQQGVAARVTTIDGHSQMGSGSLPTQNLATRLVAIEPQNLQSGELGARLRRHHPPVFARIHKGQLLLDPRTLLPGEEDYLISALALALEGSAK